MPKAFLQLLALLALAVFPFAAGAQSLAGPDFGDLEVKLKLTPLQKAQFDVAVERARLAATPG